MCPTGTSLAPAKSTSEFRRAFDVIDADHDGKISGDDLRRFYANVTGAGDGGDEELIKAMISVADANKDGFVQFDEFERVLKVQNWHDGKNGGKEERCYGEGGVMVEVFKVMDQDGDGRLGLNDLRSYLGRVGLAVGDDEIKAMIRLGGGDEREGVSFDGLVNILAVHDLVC